MFETHAHGLENAPVAFETMMAGKNTGKQVVIVDDAAAEPVPYWKRLVGRMVMWARGTELVASHASYAYVRRTS